MLPSVVPSLATGNGRWTDGVASHLSRRREAYFTICLMIAALAPVLAVRLPPMADLMGHIGRYAIQTGLEEHPWLKAYFGFEWQVIGNLGADLLVELLHPVFGVEAAVRLIVVLNQALAAAGLILICREVHGRITPFCLFALPLIYGLPFNYGFLNFTLSMALALLAFVLWLRLTRLGRVGLRNFVFVPIGLVVWTCHAFGWAFLGMLCTAAALVRSCEAGRNWQAALWHTGLSCLPLLAPLIPMLLWRGEGAAGSTSGWFEPAAKLLWLMWMLRLDWAILDKLSALGLLLLAYLAMRHRNVDGDRTLLLAAGICFAAFLLMPTGIFGSYYADMRLAPYALMLALLALDDGRLDARLRIGLTAVGLAFLTTRLAVTGATYIERERALNAHLDALSVIPDRARVVSFVSVPCPTEWELPWLSHLGGMAIARNHAFANDQWATPGMNPLSVSFPQAGEFAKAPSEMIYPERCTPHGRPMASVVASLPKGAFTHVWIAGIPASRIPHPEGSKRIWQGRDSAVFELDRTMSGVDGR